MEVERHFIWLQMENSTQKKMFKANSIYYVESIINDTHIPIN